MNYLKHSILLASILTGFSSFAQQTFSIQAQLIPLPTKDLIKFGCLAKSFFENGDALIIKVRVIDEEKQLILTTQRSPEKPEDGDKYLEEIKGNASEYKFPQDQKHIRAITDSTAYRRSEFLEITSQKAYNIGQYKGIYKNETGKSFDVDCTNWGDLIIQPGAGVGN